MTFHTCVTADTPSQCLVGALPVRLGTHLLITADSLSHLILTQEKNFLVTQRSDDPVDSHSRGHGTYTYTSLSQN